MSEHEEYINLHLNKVIQKSIYKKIIFNSSYLLSISNSDLNFFAIIKNVTIRKV